MKSAVIRFREFTDAFDRNCYLGSGDYNSPAQEQLLMDILTLVKQAPQERNDLLEEFISIIQDQRPNMKWIVVLFCMRELRWSEVEESIKKVLENGSITSDRTWKHMLTAFNPGPWRFQEHFRYYKVFEKR